MVLDVLLALQRADASIGFRYSCRVAMCGTCAIRVDGRPVLACRTPVTAATGALLLEPLAGLPVVRDLIVDTDPFWKAWRSVEPWFDTTRRRRGSSPSGRRRESRCGRGRARLHLVRGLLDRLRPRRRRARLRRAGGAEPGDDPRRRHPRRRALAPPPARLAGGRRHTLPLHPRLQRRLPEGHRPCCLDPAPPPVEHRCRPLTPPAGARDRRRDRRQRRRGPDVRVARGGRRPAPLGHDRLEGGRRPLRLHAHGPGRLQRGPRRGRLRRRALPRHARGRPVPERPGARVDARQRRAARDPRARGAVRLPVRPHGDRRPRSEAVRRPELRPHRAPGRPDRARDHGPSARPDAPNRRCGSSRTGARSTSSSTSTASCPA